jgi:hypothetical protein
MADDPEVVVEPFHPEIVVVVEPPPPDIMVQVDSSPQDVAVTISEVGLVGPAGELKPDEVEQVADAVVPIVIDRFEPEVDLTLLFENALA